MAVSLNKPEKVDLSKPECPPKMREYTPVHILDEEETIVKRPCQSPVQPQHIEDNSIEVFSEEKELEIARKNLKDLRRKYQYPFLISTSVACLIVLVVLLIRTFSPSAVHTAVENVSNTTVSAETSTYSSPVESPPAESVPMNEDNSLVSFFEILLDTSIKLLSHPAVTVMLGLSLLLFTIQIVSKVMRRY